MDWERLMEIVEFSKHEGDGGEIFGEYSNRSCGDHVRFGIVVSNGRIEKAFFKHKGCMVSKAAAETLAGMVEGKSMDEVMEISLQELMGRLGIVKTRVRCVETALKALKNAIPDQ